MKLFHFLLVLGFYTFLISCKEELPTFDFSKLYGKWYQVAHGEGHQFLEREESNITVTFMPDEKYDLKITT